MFNLDHIEREDLETLAFSSTPRGQRTNDDGRRYVLANTSLGDVWKPLDKMGRQDLEEYTLEHWEPHLGHLNPDQELDAWLEEAALVVVRTAWKGVDVDSVPLEVENLGALPGLTASRVRDRLAGLANCPEGWLELELDDKRQQVHNALERLKRAGELDTFRGPSPDTGRMCNLYIPAS